MRYRWLQGQFLSGNPCAGWGRKRKKRSADKSGIFWTAHSAWSSPVVLIRKKNGSWRLCVDYRKLNSGTIQDAYPLPRIDEYLDALAGSKYFSTLDLLSGYWQVPLSPDTQEKAMFIMRDRLWKWKVLPFKLTSAPATFQRLMEQVLRGLHWKTLLIYLDDVIVISPDFQTHVSRLREVFERLRGADIKLKPSKCALLQPEVKYLGHVVGRNGVATDPEKVRAIEEWVALQDLTGLRAFLGLVGYYRQYTPDFAGIAQPLNRLTTKGVTWQWSPVEQQAFDRLKGCLLAAPVLAYPDSALEYILDTDAGDQNVGAVLSQVQEGRGVVVAYYSKSLSPTKRNYCTTRKELLAVIKSVKHFRPYLYGRQLRLRTDHASLIWLCKRAEPSSQVAHWLEILAEFSYQIKHRPGRKHGNADGLSWRPDGGCKQCLNIERRDGGPSWSELETLANRETEYDWDQGQLQPVADRFSEAVQNLRTNPVLADNVEELRKLQKDLPGVVADVYQAKKEGRRPSEEQLRQGCAKFRLLCQRWGSLRIGQDGLLTITLAANCRHPDRKRVVCLAAMRRELIWDTHKQAHAGVQRVIAKLQLRWYWPKMGRDVRLRVRQCEICHASKHGCLPGEAGRRRLYAGRPWQVVAVDLVRPMPPTPRGNSWILVLTDHFTRWADA